MKSPHHFNKMLKVSFLFLFVSSLCSFAYYNHVEENRKANYKKFLAEFETIDIPSKLSFKAAVPQDRLSRLANKEDLKKEAPKSRILGDEFDAFIPAISQGRMSRIGPSTYQAEILVANTKKYSVLMYSKTPAYRGSHSYILATFDANGKEISKNYIGYANQRCYMNLEINEQLEIVATAMVSDDVEENAAPNFFAKSTKKIFIDDDGSIIEEKIEGTKKVKEHGKKILMVQRVG